MKVSSKFKYLALATFFTNLACLPSSYAQSVDSSPVEQLNELSVIYPESEKATGNDAWVNLNFIVSKEGQAKDILVVNSYGGSAFEQAAIDALNKVRFKPAMYKGKPVEQNIGEMTISLTSDKRSETENPVDPDFVTRYQTVLDLIKQDKYPEAEASLDEYAAKGDLSLEEIARMEVLRAQFEAKKGNPYGVLQHLRNAKIGNGIFLPQAQLIDVIRSHATIALQNSLFFEAYASQQLLERIAPENELVTRLALTTAPIRKAIQEGRNIRVRGKLDERGQWVYRPLRSNFAFTALTDGVETFEPRCERSYKKFPAETDKEWRIPASWGYCTVVISGKPGAQFELMEYPEAPDED